MCAWATLPAALKASLDYLDAYTLTWFRFTTATLVMAIWVGRSSPLTRNWKRGIWLLVISAVTLTADYILYLIGLDLTTPAIAQVLIQIALLLLALGGIWLFGERFTFTQWGGFLTLLLGLGVFFRQQLAAFATDSSRFWLGSFLIVAAGVAWAIYALVQKQLLLDYASNRIMLFIYAFATVVLLPLAAPATLGGLTTRGWIVVGYCALNTLVAYGAFAEALNHWEASRVSALLALTPLGTIGFGILMERLIPGSVGEERLDWISLAGAGLVVTGSIVASLGGGLGRATAPDPPNPTPIREQEAIGTGRSQARGSTR